jgi:hypothetical protein
MAATTGTATAGLLGLLGLTGLKQRTVETRALIAKVENETVALFQKGSRQVSS